MISEEATSVFEAEYFELQLKELKFSHLLMLITDDFRLKVQKMVQKGT